MRTAIILVVLSFVANICLAQTVPSICPIADFQGKTSEFGPRVHPVLNNSSDHNGVDLFVPTGTPVLATAGGKVVQAETVENYGVVVRIQHGAEYRTFYAHLADFTVRVGQKVNKGQLIAHSGNSGLSTGPHLHYEVIKNGTPKNPRDYFTQK
jgi:murein DD-endopeptidase MepM/ murein hydrolase activator NlpD